MYIMVNIDFYLEFQVPSEVVIVFFHFLRIYASGSQLYCPKGSNAESNTLSAVSHFELCVPGDLNKQGIPQLLKDLVVSLMSLIPGMGIAFYVSNVFVCS